MRNLGLTRDEAEGLVDLLEDCDPKLEGTWRFDLSIQIRELFGMTLVERKDCGKCGNLYMEKRCRVVESNPCPSEMDIPDSEFPMKMVLFTCPKCKHREVVRCGEIKEKAMTE